MIRFILLQNRAGKTRLAKYYVPLDDNEKRNLEYDVHRLIATRDAKFTNFVEVLQRTTPGVLKKTFFQHSFSVLSFGCCSASNEPLMEDLGIKLSISRGIIACRLHICPMYLRYLDCCSSRQIR